MHRLIKRLLSPFQTSRIEVTLDVDYDKWQELFAIAKERNLKEFYVEIKGMNAPDVKLTFVSTKARLNQSLKAGFKDL